MNNSETYRRRRARRPLLHRISSPVRMASAVVAVALVLGCSLLALGQKFRVTPLPEQQQTPQALMATAIKPGVPSMPLKYKGFDVYFNPVKHIPNAVAWYLTAERAQGTVPRINKFNADPTVIGCATLADYRRSGFDRGHMAPAGDMKWDSTAMIESHYLTNMCPQDHAANAGRWKTVEEMTRRWAVRDSLLIIVAGPVITDLMPRTIGDGVAVPERFFKVILAPAANPPRAIGFIMPNAYTPDGVEALVHTVDQIETITGYDFFSALPDDVENRVEARADFRTWNRRRR